MLHREEISVDQELAQLHQSRDELERGNQSLMQELANMNRKYVRPPLLEAFTVSCSRNISAGD